MIDYLFVCSIVLEIESRASQALPDCAKTSQRCLTQGSSFGKYVRRGSEYRQMEYDEKKIPHNLLQSGFQTQPRLTASVAFSL